MNKRGKGELCAYCRRVLHSTMSQSKTAATRDHTIPLSRGGRHKVWCCRQCNTLKGNKSPDEWAAFMAAHPEWWRLPEFQVGTNHRRQTPPRAVPRPVTTEVRVDPPRVLHTTKAEKQRFAEPTNRIPDPTASLARARARAETRQRLRYGSGDT